MNRFAFAALVVLATLATLVPDAQAQGWPQQRPVRLLVGFGPGSATDTMARLLAERLAGALKTSVVVENREGAGGAIGTAAAAKAPPDGHSILLGVTTLTVSPHMQANPSYDPIADLVPIVKVAELPLMLIVNTDAPFKTLRDLVAHARANPGALSYATSGKGSPSHLAVELIRQATKIDVRDIPYKNVGQAMTDTISGQISFYFPAITAGIPQVKGGKVRPLAVGAVQRSPQMPAVPTLVEEIGTPGLEVITWYGLFGPAGISRDIVNRLHTETARLMEGAELRDRIVKGGFDIAVSGPEEFGAQVRADVAKYGKLVRELGLKE